MRRTMTFVISCNDFSNRSKNLAALGSNREFTVPVSPKDTLENLRAKLIEKYPELKHRIQVRTEINGKISHDGPLTDPQGNFYKGILLIKTDTETATEQHGYKKYEEALKERELMAPERYRLEAALPDIPCYSRIMEVIKASRLHSFGSGSPYYSELRAARHSEARFALEILQSLGALLINSGLAYSRDRTEENILTSLANTLTSCHPNMPLVTDTAEIAAAVNDDLLEPLSKKRKIDLKKMYYAIPFYDKHLTVATAGHIRELNRSVLRFMFLAKVALDHLPEKMIQSVSQSLSRDAWNLTVNQDSCDVRLSTGSIVAEEVASYILDHYCRANFPGNTQNGEYCPNSLCGFPRAFMTELNSMGIKFNTDPAIAIKSFLSRGSMLEIDSPWFKISQSGSAQQLQAVPTTAQKFSLFNLFLQSKEDTYEKLKKEISKYIRELDTKPITTTQKHAHKKAVLQAALNYLEASLELKQIVYNAYVQAKKENPNYKDGLLSKTDSLVNRLDALIEKDKEAQLTLVKSDVSCRAFGM